MANPVLHRGTSGGDATAVARAAYRRDVEPGARMRSWLWTACLVLLGGLLVGTAPAAGDDGGRTVPTGELVPGMHCLVDAGQSYTLYLPPGYTTERRWPALLILDPRGRSELAAELFRPAAERYGWILLSSDDTRSDGPMAPNDRALAAMWPELSRRYAVDPRRLYAAGFSGGAHFAWLLGQRTGGLAGVIASGGRLLPELLKGTDFAVFGAAGTTDFNYRGMLAVDELLAAQGNPHRLEIFDGPHQWLPPGLAIAGVEWLELEAMRSGRRPVDATFVDHQWAAETAAAARLEATGEVLAAQRRWAMIARSFAGLRPVAEAARAADRVAGSQAFRSAHKEAEHWLRYETAYLDELFGFAAELRETTAPVSFGAAARRLRLDRLAGWAAGDGLRAVTARRLLATVWAQTSFYLTREFLASGRPPQAALVLEIATAIRPEDARSWYNLACARARCGRSDAALDALEQAVALGFADRDLIAADPDLESLRGLDRLHRVLDSLR